LVWTAVIDYVLPGGLPYYNFHNDCLNWHAFCVF